jgi:hypothetical protein
LNNVDKIWRPNDKDIVAGLWPRRYNKAMTGASVAAQVIVADTEVFPIDLIREIHSVTFSWVPGAAQTPVSAHLVCVDANTGVIVGSVASGMPSFAPAAGAPGAIFTLSGIDYPMMSNEKLTCFAQFNAGAASNSIDIYVTGFEYPRGNFQR